MIKAVQALGQPAMRLRAADGAEATVLLHGAHIVSWIPAGDQERLYLWPLSIADADSSVLGGIPVVFPQFAQRGALPRHGLARNRTWQWVEGAERDGAVIGVLRLCSDAATAALWPHDFETELTLSVRGLELDIELAVTNTGDAPLDFAAALHTTLRCDDLRRARLSGLYGTRYVDLASGQEQCQEMDPFSFVGAINRVYRDVRASVSLSTAIGRMSLSQEGFDDLVVWNPGPHSPAAETDAGADWPADGWLHMLGIAAANIERPVRLAPGQQWWGRQRLAA